MLLSGEKILPTTILRFRKVFKDLNWNENDSIFLMGCGKQSEICCFKNNL
jgi:hypothetical protein